MSSPTNSTFSTMARPKLKRAATAQRQRVDTKTDPLDLCGLIAPLAARHKLGTIGLAGTHAIGSAEAHDPVELIVTVSLSRAEAFAQELSEATERAVHLYAFDLLPWAHPLHLCVKWLNVDRMPIAECPRGAVSRWKIVRNGSDFETAVRLDSLSHFRSADRFVPA